jgi:hypothetical protein
MRLVHWSAMKFPDTLSSGYADLSLIWKPAASWAHANAVVLCSLPENWSWCICSLAEIYGLLLCPQLRLTDAALKSFCTADTSLISMNIFWKPCSYMVQVICSLCSHEQDVQQVCENCGVCMGEYFCSICKFFDDEVDNLLFAKFYCWWQILLFSLQILSCWGQHLLFAKLYSWYI